MAIHEVTYYQAKCDLCGHIQDEYGDFAAFSDDGAPADHVIDYLDWARLGDGELVCRECFDKLPDADANGGE